MEKQKSWHYYVIATVMLLTIYNILPTLFYYTKPLQSPIDHKRSEAVVDGIVARVNGLEQEAIDWLASFCKLLKVSPESIAVRKDDASLIDLTFAKAEDAERFRRFLPKAGELIPFAPAQLELQSSGSAANERQVTVARQVGVAFDPAQTARFFAFVKKYDDQTISAAYRGLAFDRLEELVRTMTGENQLAKTVKFAIHSDDQQGDEAVVQLANTIVEVNRVFGMQDPIAKRIFATFSKSDVAGGKANVEAFAAKMEKVKNKLSTAIVSLEQQQKKQSEENKLEGQTDERLAGLVRQQKIVDSALALLKGNLSLFTTSSTSPDRTKIKDELEKGFAGVTAEQPIQTIPLNGANPFIESLVVNWSSDKIDYVLYPDVVKLREQATQSEEQALKREKLNQLLINEIAQISRETDETINPTQWGFSTALTKLPNTESFLVLQLGQIAAERAGQIKQSLQTEWNPSYTDFVREHFPIYDWSQYQALSKGDQKLGLVVYAPAAESTKLPLGFQNGSIYIIARGMDAILQKSKQGADSEDKQLLNRDFNELVQILRQKGFIAYPGSSYQVDPEFKNDYIFELDGYYAYLLKATREDFSVLGTKKNAVLEFSDVAQRIKTENAIGNQIQDDLVKWQDEYHSARVNLDPATRLTVPAPTKNPYWENFKLSVAKYFRGDDRKILKWGLDLSGGKTVRIGLRDANGKKVTDPEDIKLAVKELYERINKLGVAERTIRVENENIILEFPGSQDLSAAELIKPSTMYFHIVNEKFSNRSSPLFGAANEFLQDVWNEAVVTNRKDVKSINEIAWEHLGGSADSGEFHPRTEAAKRLVEGGLTLVRSGTVPMSTDFNDALSSIALLRGDDYMSWHGATHPLMVVFYNYALEGSSLTNVQVGYDPSKGNTLSFEVKKAYEGTQNRGSSNPRNDFFSWTSQFSTEKIMGTQKELYSGGMGWRMAVVFNDQIISSPTLNGSLKEGGTIEGRFTSREVNQFASELKAGSLTFTPYILSEENVSPELGKEERTKGIGASIVALVLVVLAMVGYYRFAGVVASCAVLFNLLIMWGVLQNIGAALTLPGIAGIVLTIGMAVDANVLVFERIREEFRVSGRIASAIQAGYRKAFSAIVDSNVTTIIAAVILIQFDSGPIKGFAVTLIIGILSSMFTALFMTRTYFARWVMNPEHKRLEMAQFFTETNFDFMKKAKAAIIASVAIMAIGAVFFVAQWNTMFGMDFTGGYSMHVELQENQNPPNYRLSAIEALIAGGASSKDIAVRELSKPNKLQIQLGITMEEKGHPFYGMPEFSEKKEITHPFENNPRIEWVVNALASKNLSILDSELAQLDKNWTVMSGQLSEGMRYNAAIALGLALLSVLIYITIRFEFKYALAAVVALAHDVLITLGLLAFFNWMGFAVQIDLQVIGAIMTIIGYSLNDTIIVFDRLREDQRVLRKLPFVEIINHALNVTLSRTLMTSGTTLLVLFTLVLLGGQSIFAFSLVMTIGVLVGTFSSLFIASPVMLYIHNREQDQLQKA